MSFDLNLTTQRIPPEKLAEAALEDDALMHELLDGVSAQAQKEAKRQNCSKALMFMAETWPEALLPHWDYFVTLLKCSNGYSKYVAVYVITSLSKVDHTGRFEEIFDDYFALLGDESVMVAAHAAGCAGRLALAKPNLQAEIVHRLLQIDKLPVDPGRRGLVKAYIIEALDLVFESSSNKAEILEFVRQQLENESAKTRKLAKAFIKKWDSA
jgi:hypothetical protein